MRIEHNYIIFKLIASIQTHYKKVLCNYWNEILIGNFQQNILLRELKIHSQSSNYSANAMIVFEIITNQYQYPKWKYTK